MARSKWKLNFFSKDVWRKSKSDFFLKKKFFQRIIYSRSSNIPFFFKNHLIKIHKGNCFSYVLVNFFNIGFKFGEFSFTKKPFHYPLKKKKK